MKNSSTGSSERDAGAFGRYVMWVALGIVLVLVLAETALRRLIVPIDDTRANRTALVYTARGDDVILGDSHLYRAFINSDRFVNLARAGSSPHALEIVAHEYFRYRTPGRVIVQASPQLFNHLMQTRGAQHHDEFFSLNRLRLPFTPYVFEPGISRQLALLWDRDELRRMTATAHGRKKLRGGVVEREAAARRALTRSEARKAASERVRSNRPADDVRSSRGFAAYRRMIDVLLAEGARVCLARTPVDDAYLEIEREDPRANDAHDAMQALARELDLPYVDFRDLDLGLDIASFTNADHLTTAAGGDYAEALERACFP